VEQPEATEPSMATASPDAVESLIATAVPDATEPFSANAPPEVIPSWWPSSAAAGPARKATMPTKPATIATNDIVARLFVVIVSFFRSGNCL
jgi:hypothetical protein